MLFSNLDFLALRPEFAQWLAANPSQTFANLPNPLLRAVIERLFLPVKDLLSIHSNIPGFFVGKPRESVRPMFAESITFQLTGEGDYPFTTTVVLGWQDHATLLPLVETIEALPKRNLLSSVVHASCTLVPIIAVMRMSCAEVSSLGDGDVILPTQVFESPLLFVHKDCLLTTETAEQTLTVTGRALHDFHALFGGGSMSEQESLVTTEDLETLELDVCFTLPTLHMPVVDCANIAPGMTFSLANSIQDLPIDVVCAGKCIAQGRLVDVGGTIGVQVVRVKNDSGNHS